MYIEPNTTIKLITNCPLDDTYEHTLFFSTKDEQHGYFESKVKYTLDKQTYQRVNKHRMRVQYKADDIYDCNYLMFRNTSFGNKWFYAFIKSVEYVNNITSEIEYVIDVMQTWHFDYTLGQCFIDREHSSSDAFGENLVPEKLETGDYVIDDASTHEELYQDYKWVLATTFKRDATGVSWFDYAGGIWGGLWSGLYYNVFDTHKQMENFINLAGPKTTEGIVCAFMIPSAFCTDENGNNLEPRTRSFTVPGGYYYGNGNPKRFQGYTPKNKKLYSYPYNFLYVTNLQGEAAEFPYEYFRYTDDVTTPTFGSIASMSANPECTIYPQGYKGVLYGNFDERMTIRGWPMLSWNSDAFKAYLAQSSSAVATALGGATAATVAANSAAPLSMETGLATYSAANAAFGASLSTSAMPVIPIGAAIAAAGALASAAKAAVTPPRNHPGSGSTVLAADKKLGFVFYRKHIRAEFAKIIDNYFTMYGYATHRTKVPNRHVRKGWTYTKTAGCVVHGSVPCDDMSKICAIYNNGVTFWDYHYEIGDYSVDNSPL